MRLIRFIRQSSLILLFTSGCAVYAPVTEPQGYWSGDIHAPVPSTIRGGKAIDTKEARRLVGKGGVVIIDASGAQRKPPELPADTTWLPAPHKAIPGAFWMPGVGDAAIQADLDEMFRKRLSQLTGDNLSSPILLYCHQQCWLSWNAAKRVISYGYRRVYWFSAGIEGWSKAKLLTSFVRPIEVQVAPQP